MTFPFTSRYYGVEIGALETGEFDLSGSPVVILYLKRRMVPQPERFSTLQEHTVAEGERLDNITAHYLGDPEAFWRICDANGVLHPEELTEQVGRRIRITLPEGIPGTPNG